MGAPVKISLAGIRKALEGAVAPGSVHKTTLDSIMARLDWAMAKRRKAALEAVTIPPAVLARHHYELYQRPGRQLTAADYHGVIVLHSPMGTGKTKDRRPVRPLWHAGRGSSGDLPPGQPGQFIVAVTWIPSTMAMLTSNGRGISMP